MWMRLFTELRRRPAMEALYWADRARARGRNSSSAFYRPRGRGRASLGWANWGLAARGGAARGDRRPAVTGLRRRVSSSGGSPAGSGATQTRGAGAVLGGGATRGAARWLRRRTAPPWARCRETEVEESVSGNFVIRPKFQNPVL